MDPPPPLTMLTLSLLFCIPRSPFWLPSLPFPQAPPEGAEGVAVRALDSGVPEILGLPRLWEMIVGAALRQQGPVGVIVVPGGVS